MPRVLYQKSSLKQKLSVWVRGDRVAFPMKRLVLRASIFKPAVVVQTSKWLRLFASGKKLPVFLKFPCVYEPDAPWVLVLTICTIRRSETRYRWHFRRIRFRPRRFCIDLYPAPRKMIKSILIGFLSPPSSFFTTVVVFLRNVYFCPLFVCIV